MAYRLKIGETPQQALRRIALEQIERASLALSAANGTGNPIHETRKCLKRIRALLRLMRPGLDDTIFCSENARFRTIAQLLAPTRDTHILLETILKLEPFADDAHTPAIAALKDHIGHQLLATATGSANPAGDLARHQLSDARIAVAKLKLNSRGFEPIERGLRDSYRRGRHNFEQAYQAGTGKAFHDLRKSVQLHWRHMALLSRAWPEMFSTRVEAARQLSQILGDSQDLCVLISYIEGVAPDVLPHLQAQQVAQLARQRQQQLRGLAHPRGAQMFALSPKTLSRCVIETWLAATAIEDMSIETPAAMGPPPPHAKPGERDTAIVTAIRPATTTKRRRSQA